MVGLVREQANTKWAMYGAKLLNVVLAILIGTFLPSRHLVTVESVWHATEHSSQAKVSYLQMSCRTNEKVGRLQVLKQGKKQAK